MNQDPLKNFRLCCDHCGEDNLREPVRILYKEDFLNLCNQCAAEAISLTLNEKDEKERSEWLDKVYEARRERTLKPRYYLNLLELAEAYRIGELSKKDSLIIGEGAVVLYKPDIHGDEVCVFDGENPYLLLARALDILGIPWRWS